MPASLNRPPKPPTNVSLTAPPPPPLSSITFVTPSKQLVSVNDLALYRASPTHHLIVAFVTDLRNSVLNLPNSHPCEISPLVQKLLAILEEVQKLVDEHPAEEAAGRFGNKAFVGFYDAVSEKAAGWHKELGLSGDAMVDEVKQYFVESFGNRTRIDYGSGHELNFISWL